MFEINQHQSTSTKTTHVYQNPSTSTNNQQTSINITKKKTSIKFNQNRHNSTTNQQTTMNINHIWEGGREEPVQRLVTPAPWLLSRVE